MSKKIFLVIFILFTLTFSAWAQSTKTLTLPKPTPKPSKPTPGNIELFDGYTHTPKRGIDSTVGEISKPGGMTIHYDIGDLAGLFAGRCGPLYECLWYKGQKINGREVWLSLTKDGRIFATFPKDYANFFAQTNSSEDIADFLVMILTYKVKEPEVEKKIEGKKFKQK
jgi:hypothetical protein